MIGKVFADGELRAYLNANSSDPWKGTHLEGYVHCDPKHKGVFGEMFAKKLLVEAGYTVEDRMSSGHDWILKGGPGKLDAAGSCGKKLEVKFGVATRATLKQRATGYAAKLVRELKALLGARGLTRGGNKPELIQRLQEWDKKNPSDPPKPICDRGVIKDSFIMNHVSQAKDWDILLFIGVNPDSDDLRLLWFTRENFGRHVMEDGRCFGRQQGGQKVQNDDWMCTKIGELMKQSWVKCGIDGGSIVGH